MAENILMNFLIKRAYTPWVDNDLPEIANSSNWEDFSYDPDVLASHKYNAKLNALKESFSPEAWNKFVNDVSYRYRGTPNDYEISNFLKSYNSPRPESFREYKPYTSTPAKYGIPEVTRSSSIEINPYKVSDSVIDEPVSITMPDLNVNIPDLATESASEPEPTTNHLSELGTNYLSSVKPNYITSTAPASNTAAEPVATSAPAASEPVPGPAKTTVMAHASAPAATSDAQALHNPLDTSKHAPAAEPVKTTVTTPVSTAPASTTQATQNPFYAPKSITRQQMQQYRRYTGANDMKSDMDRWKTYQAMNGNRNASNADYYAAKRNNTLDKVVNPIPVKSK